VLALAIFGGEVIRGFSIAMVWGIVIGTYSTISVATPLLLYMHIHRIRGKDEKAAAEKTAAEKKSASGTVARRGT
jgi:preprotein translocase subunit SecF